MDCVFGNQEAREMITCTKVWKDYYIGDSDHRLVLCVTKLRKTITHAENLGKIGSRLPNRYKLICKGGLKYVQL